MKFKYLNIHPTRLFGPTRYSFNWHLRVPRFFALFLQNQNKTNYEILGNFQLKFLSSIKCRHEKNMIDSVDPAIQELKQIF